MPIHYIKSMQNWIFNKTGISSHYICKKNLCRMWWKISLAKFYKKWAIYSMSDLHVVKYTQRKICCYTFLMKIWKICLCYEYLIWQTSFHIKIFYRHILVFHSFAQYILESFNYFSFQVRQKKVRTFSW